MKALYVTDRAAIGDERFANLLAALSDCPGLAVQLREKGSPDRDALGRAREARRVLGSAIPLYVNRRFDIALAAGAQGVHLPADGLPPGRVRSSTPRGFRIGVSAHAPEEAAAAIEQGADLVVLGPIFDTPSKRSWGPPLGPAALSRLPRKDTHSCDVFAIGGIDESNLGHLLPYGDRITGIAAIRLFQEAADPRAAVRRIAAA